MKIEVGTRVYFNGDLANPEGFGIVTEKDDGGKFEFPPQVKIKFDDGREFWTYETGFSEEYLGHGGTRFVTEEAYNKFYA